MAHSNDLALLRIELADIIPASALKNIVAILGDLYFGHLWLDLAEASTEPGPFPDEYTTSPDETLYVNRLEIGTPNFLELLGLVDPLIGVFTYVGGLAGLIATGKGIMTLVKDYYDIQDKRSSIQEKQLKIRQLARELEAGEVKARVEHQPVDFSRSEADLELRALPLYKHGRISSIAMEHKAKMSQDIKMTASYFLPEFCKKPSLIVIEKPKK
jgi:hypothetical protein